MKRLPVIQIISGSGALNQPTTIGQPGDRGCVSCGTIYQAEAYTQHGAYETLLVDGRGRYWCLDCAASALMNVRRRTDERTDYVYPWTFDETGGLAGQHARVQKIEGTKQCPKCGAQSGDDFRQCEGSCPMPDSPHYNESCARAFENDCTVGAGVPSRSYTREVAAATAVRKPEFSYVTPIDPKKITEQTTLAELAEQRTLLGVQVVAVHANIRETGHARAVVVYHPVHGSHLGFGKTEAEAIEDAFSNLRRTTLPEPLKALLKDDPKP